MRKVRETKGKKKGKMTHLGGHLYEFPQVSLEQGECLSREDALLVQCHKDIKKREREEVMGKREVRRQKRKEREGDNLLVVICICIPTGKS